jgi:hypothetical protein
VERAPNLKGKERKDGKKSIQTAPNVTSPWAWGKKKMAHKEDK